MGLTHSPIGPSDGLVLCLDTANRRSYPGSGTNWFDLSGNGNHGVLTNGPTLNTGPGGGMSFDGVNDFIAIQLPLVANLTRCTIAYWYRRIQTSTFAGFFGFGVPNTMDARFVVQPWSDGQIYISFAGNTWANFANNDLSWHNIIAVFDGNASGNANRLRVYFDNNQQTLSFTGTIPSSIGTPTACRIGQTFNDTMPYSNGPIDDCRIYNRVLTPAEAFRLYEIKKRRFQ